jgi:hypothetical protein
LVARLYRKVCNWECFALCSRYFNAEFSPTPRRRALHRYRRHRHPRAARHRAATAPAAAPTRVGKIEFELGFPSKNAVNKPYNEVDVQRGCQAYIWGLPIIGFAEWQASATKSLGACELAVDGSRFDGGKNYRLRVPPNAPDKQFWSVTLYDVDTRSFIVTKELIGDRSSRMGVKNADGSVDIYSGHPGSVKRCFRCCLCWLLLN